MEIIVVFWLLFLYAFASAQGQENDFQKGITNVKIKNGIVSFKKQVPPAEIQMYLTSKLVGERNGFYEIEYEMEDVSNESTLSIKKEKLTHLLGKFGKQLLVYYSCLLA
jgi:hypothetical protein